MTFDPRQHPRGKNPENPGQFSTKERGDVALDASDVSAEDGARVLREALVDVKERQKGLTFLEEVQVDGDRVVVTAINEQKTSMTPEDAEGLARLMTDDKRQNDSFIGEDIYAAKYAGMVMTLHRSAARSVEALEGRFEARLVDSESAEVTLKDGTEVRLGAHDLDTLCDDEPGSSKSYLDRKTRRAYTMVDSGGEADLKTWASIIAERLSESTKGSGLAAKESGRPNCVDIEASGHRATIHDQFAGELAYAANSGKDFTRTFGSADMDHWYPYEFSRSNGGPVTMYPSATVTAHLLRRQLPVMSSHEESTSASHAVIRRMDSGVVRLGAADMDELYRRVRDNQPGGEFTDMDSGEKVTYNGEGLV